MNKLNQLSAVTPRDETLSHGDAVHEQYIKHLGTQMMSHHAQWEATGCFDARGAADGYRMSMERAIGQRSPAVVAFMEAERGLA